MNPSFVKHPRLLFGALGLGLIIFLAIFAPLLTNYAVDDTSLELRLAPISSLHWFGGDLYGGDVYTRFLFGARTSLMVGVLALAGILLMGVSLGLVAGYYGGLIDLILMGVIDILMAFPGILLAMAISSILTPSVFNIILTITLTGWTAMARLIRGQVLTLKERDFVSSARALGASDFKIIFKYILPLLWAPLVVCATFTLSSVIIVEASLSFLGFGAKGISPSWGGLLSQGKSVIAEAPHLSIFPGLGILLLILSLNFLGDGLRDYLDPKS